MSSKDKVAAWRAKLSEDKKKQMRDADRERRAKKRAAMTEEEKVASREKDRARKAAKKSESAKNHGKARRRPVNTLWSHIEPKLVAESQHFKKSEKTSWSYPKPSLESKENSQNIAKNSANNDDDDDEDSELDMYGADDDDLEQLAT